jgi:hypothetical protein
MFAGVLIPGSANRRSDNCSYSVSISEKDKSLSLTGLFDGLPEKKSIFIVTHEFFPRLLSDNPFNREY